MKKDRESVLQYCMALVFRMMLKKIQLSVNSLNQSKKCTRSIRFSVSSLCYVLLKRIAGGGFPKF